MEKINEAKLNIVIDDHLWPILSEIGFNILETHKKLSTKGDSNVQISVQEAQEILLEAIPEYVFEAMNTKTTSSTL